MESTTYIYIFLFIYIFICILCISFYIYVSGLRSFLWVNALYHRIVFITQFTESFWNRGTAEVHHDDSFFLHTHFFFSFFFFCCFGHWRERRSFIDMYILLYITFLIHRSGRPKRWRTRRENVLFLTSHCQSGQRTHIKRGLYGRL